MKLGLFGSTGKMGLAVAQLVDQDAKKTFTPYLAVGKNTSNLFAMTMSDLNDIESDVLEDVDVWIDFSSAAGLFDLLSATNVSATAIVSGTTGLEKKDFLKPLSFFWDMAFLIKTNIHH